MKKLLVILLLIGIPSIAFSNPPTMTKAEKLVQLQLMLRGQSNWVWSEELNTIQLCFDIPGISIPLCTRVPETYVVIHPNGSHI